METKVCTVCGEDKPLDQYRKYSGRGRLGLRPLCKVCQRAYEMAWRSNSVESRKEARLRRKDKAEIYSRKWRMENRAAYLISECRRRCLKKGIPFDLDMHSQELQQRISRGICEVSGIAMDATADPGRRFNAPSIDRINPAAGYVIGNVRVVAFCVNAMMGDWGESVAIQVMKEWLKNKE